MAWLISNALITACESSHSLPAQAAESLEGTCSAGAPCVPSSGTPTPQAYLWLDRTTAAWRRFPSGMTCSPLTDDRGKAVLTWCLEGSPVRTSAQQDAAPASTEQSPECGDTWRALSVRFDPATASWRTAHSEDIRRVEIVFKKAERFLMFKLLTDVVHPLLAAAFVSLAGR